MKYGEWRRQMAECEGRTCDAPAHERALRAEEDRYLAVAEEIYEQDDALERVGEERDAWLAIAEVEHRWRLASYRHWVEQMGREPRYETVVYRAGQSEEGRERRSWRGPLSVFGLLALLGNEECASCRLGVLRGVSGGDAFACPCGLTYARVRVFGLREEDGAA